MVKMQFLKLKQRRNDFMKKNQIKVKKLKNGTKTIVTIKNGMVYNRTGKSKIYCSCTGNTEQTATPMRYNKTKGVYCPNCDEKKVEVIQTYEQWKAEKDAKEKRMNEKKLATLHLVERGSDWECGFKFYGLSANIDYDDWLKVKEHFRYYKRGWSRGQELEWNYGEPCGWLTRNPEAVEKILVDVGLIKHENTMEAISERKRLEKQKKEKEQKLRIAKRNELKEKMDIIEEEINDSFDVSEKRELSDAEANEHYFNATFGKCTVLTYTITDTEIIRCRNMGDFKYGVSIPYSKNVENLIKDYYILSGELLSC